MRDQVISQVLPVQVEPGSLASVTDQTMDRLHAIQREAARTAIRALASLATIGENDHLGGGLELIPPFALTVALADFERTTYTIEHAHTSVGYYGTLAAFGFLEEDVVVERFRRGLDIAGHVAWVPGGTQLNGGRLGVMIPAAVGQALGIRARHDEGWVLCHCGDAGWISGQALNGFNGADLHDAPVTFVMHRNGIQLSGTTRSIMDKDPRPIIEAMGITILETANLWDLRALSKTYAEAHALAKEGRPNLIYPVGYGAGDEIFTLTQLGDLLHIAADLEAFAGSHGVSLDTNVWVPGSLMSYRDVISMLECIFLVNGLPGGKAHHDGDMKGREEADVLSNSMLDRTPEHVALWDALQAEPKREIVTEARPAFGTRNLNLSDSVLHGIELPGTDKWVSPRAGSQAAYEAVAAAHPESVFVVSCDLDESTKLHKARHHLADDHQFEMSIEEQVSAIMANGLAMSGNEPQLNVFSTFAAFFEGIAREGLEMWRYQRNLNGVNEGLNVAMHLSHVGACTGRDHFSGWSLDWITLAMGYLPYLRRFYTPADARGAFLAVRDMASAYGGHIIGIPRDKLPILTQQGSDTPLWEADSPWEPSTLLRKQDGARKAIVAVGATAYLAAEASERLQQEGSPVDAYVVNGLPLGDDTVADWLTAYPDGVVTVEDGIIAEPSVGLRGFASLIRSMAYGSGVPVQHVGIVDPTLAPSHGHEECWAHFGITSEAIMAAAVNMS